MSHQQQLAKDRAEILSEPSLRRLIQSRIETVGLLNSQTDPICVMAEEVISLRSKLENLQSRRLHRKKAK
jgi:hypothetical protein